MLKAIDDDDLQMLAKRALARDNSSVALTDAALDWLVTQADGDARRLLNQLEIVLQSFGAGVIDDQKIASVLSQSRRAFDKGGDNFYDQISALHKSVRGSDPDAALYWLARMLDGGADARYLARRIIRMAWEDVGLADPRAIQIAHDAADAFDRLGAPEGELALGQAVIYLSVAAKSNAGYTAYNRARAFVAQDRSREVPNHLRNAPTKLARDIGHSQGYRYAHDEPGGFAAGQRYLPDGMPPPGWYQPVERGLEMSIGQKLSNCVSLTRRRQNRGRRLITKGWSSTWQWL